MLHLNRLYVFFVETCHGKSLQFAVETRHACPVYFTGTCLYEKTLCTVFTLNICFLYWDAL